MPEIRFDALTAGFSVIATERSKRPSDFMSASAPHAESPERDEKCPFCPGNESQTPPEIWAKREGGDRDGPGWTIRVVPNKFPALVQRSDDAGFDEFRVSPFPEAPEGTLYWQSPGVGRHEVVVESPVHNGRFSTYSREQTKEILATLKARCLELYDDKDISYVQVFKNQGKKAGASLTHPHFQIIAMPVMPPGISQEGYRLREYESKTRRCLICDLLERELEKDVRVVMKTDMFAVICPFASRYSYETVIVPLEHISGLTEAGDAALADLASVLGGLSGAYDSMFPDLPYNLVIHGLPAKVRTNRGWPYHAHIHVYPRLNTEAGLELGTGVFINPTPPELAAVEFVKAMEA